VRGAALGGGCELALVCDLVLAAESATFGLPEIRLGVFPPVAAILLPRLVGARRAADLVLTGRTLSAHEAERAGIASRVVADDEFDAALETLLIELRALSAPALRVAKRALRFAGGSLTSEEIAEAEAIYMNERLKAPDAIEGLEAFLEKRAPRWAGGS
jgi:cyclohexa-1,5-dienecarbonyl-CoA hydratase